jgi:hypothetical protein
MQTLQGTLEIEIQGTLMEQFDRLHVGGDVMLDGTLEVVPIPGLAPGLTVQVISNDGAATGFFRSVDTVDNDLIFFAPTYSSVFLTSFLEGDMNLDTMYTPSDVDEFVLALRNRESYFGTYFIEGDESGDIDDDNDLDFDDIDEFAGLIPGVSSGQIVQLLMGIPEPGTIVMALIAGGLFAVRRSRTRH